MASEYLLQITTGFSFRRTTDENGIGKIIFIVAIPIRSIVIVEPLRACTYLKSKTITFTRSKTCKK